MDWWHLCTWAAFRFEGHRTALIDIDCRVCSGEWIYPVSSTGFFPPRQNSLGVYSQCSSSSSHYVYTRSMLSTAIAVQNSELAHILDNNFLESCLIWRKKRCPERRPVLELCAQSICLSAYPTKLSHTHGHTTRLISVVFKHHNWRCSFHQSLRHHFSPWRILRVCTRLLEWIPTLMRPQSGGGSVDQWWEMTWNDHNMTYAPYDAFEGRHTDDLLFDATLSASWDGRDSQDRRDRYSFPAQDKNQDNENATAEPEAKLVHWMPGFRFTCCFDSKSDSGFRKLQMRMRPALLLFVGKQVDDRVPEPGLGALWSQTSVSLWLHRLCGRRGAALSLGVPYNMSTCTL